MNEDAAQMQRNEQRHSKTWDVFHGVWSVQGSLIDWRESPDIRYRIWNHGAGTQGSAATRAHTHVGLGGRLCQSGHTWPDMGVAYAKYFEMMKIFQKYL